MELKQLPKVALGASAWGNDGTFGGSLSAADLRPVFDAAMKAGLNLWDTAYVYGMGTSEKVLGEFLRTVPRESYLISDKFTPQCADPAAQNAVTAMYEVSAKLLGTDAMDIYWIHNPVGAPQWTRKLISLAKSGKIGRIGLSNHNLAEIKEAAAILEEEGLKISAIQNHYSLLNRSSETSGILATVRKTASPSSPTWCWSRGPLPESMTPTIPSRQIPIGGRYTIPCSLNWKSSMRG